MERNEFTKSIESIFGNTEKFLDIIEEDLPVGYDFLYSDDGMSGEIYIVDREAHQYINWYKETHIGRDLHTNMTDVEIIQFLKKLHEKHSLPKEEQ